jgi:hypothetical protein
MSSVRPIALLPLLALGFLTLALQTLLLRAFLWRVSATEIGVGVFLAAWLAWVGVGALAARTRPGERLVVLLAHHFPWALALYLPLAALQFLLIEQLRAILGIPEYLASPIGHLALGALVANAPISLATGMLFPAGARWLAARGGSTALAYALDAAGAVVAGVLVTAALAAGVRLEGGHVRDWQRCFPGSRPAGLVVTPAATYAHGTCGGTFYTLSAGGVVDMLPDPERPVEIAALLTSQKPDARRVLLLGQVPLSVVLALHAFLPAASITWCHSDPSYARWLLQEQGGEAAGAVTVAPVGPQQYLAGSPPVAEIVLVYPSSLGSAASAALVERAFLRQLCGWTGAESLVALPLGGGPGAWSEEQCRLAAAVVGNAQEVFPEAGLLAPGAGCWWLAGRSSGAVVTPERAAAGFAAAPREKFPKAALAELYDTRRAAQLRALLAPEAVPVQRRGVAALLHAECPAFPLARRVAWLERHAGMAIPLLLLGAAWLLWAACGARTQAAARLDMAWLAAGGFLGLTGLLALLQVQEKTCGDLYLLAGLDSSLFLAGLVAGNRWASRTGALVPGQLAVVSLIHGLLLAVLVPAAEALGTPTAVAAACLVAGVPAGWYVPVAARQLQSAGVSEQGLGARVILADAFGSAAGGMLASLLLLPWLGAWRTCLAVAPLAVGIGCCAAVAPPGARLAARFGLVGCLVAAGILCLMPAASPAAPGKSATATSLPVIAPPAAATNVRVETPAPAADESLPPTGKPRPVDMPRLRARQEKGELSKHPAECWEPETPATGP